MQQSGMAVFGSTLYADPTNQRYQSCLLFLRQAKDRGIPVFLADASPHAEVVEQLRSLANVTQVRGMTMQAQKATALFHAHQSGAVGLIHSELEKCDLVRDLERLCRPILMGSTALMIPKRSVQSWETFPAEMREVEGFALDMLERYLGRRLDLMFGPFAFHRRCTELFLDCQAPNWSWLHLPRLQIIHNGELLVGEIEVDFSYPEIQKRNEEGNPDFLRKRLEQLSYILNPLLSVYG